MPFLNSAPSLVEDRDTRAAKRDRLVAHHVHVALLHLVGLKPLEREAGQVAGAGADAAQGHARHALHWISCYEGASLVHVLGQAHVAESGVIRPRHHLKEVVVLGKVFCRILWILQDNVDIGAGRSASAIPGMRCRRLECLGAPGP